MRKQKQIAILLLSLLVAGTGFSLLAYHRRSHHPTVISKPAAVNKVNYSGPTPQEKAVGNSQKSATVTRDQLNNASTTDQMPASITIVDSSQYDDVFEVRAFISNVFEDGGICTASLSRSGSTTVSSQSSASSSATTTQCAKIDIPISQFDTKGNWQLVVTYLSTHSSGSTESKTVTIQ